MSISTSKHDDVIEVAADGELTIATARELADAVRGAMEGSGRVVIRFGKISSVDVTLVQILCAACRLAGERSKELTLVGEIPPDVRSFLQEMGGERISPCRHNGGLPCIWFGGGA